MTRLSIPSSPRRRDLHLHSLALTVGLGLFAGCPGESPGDSATVGLTGSSSTTQDGPDPGATEPTGTATAPGTTETSTPGTDSETGATGDTGSGSTTEPATASSTSEETASSSTTAPATASSTSEETASSGTTEPATASSTSEAETASSSSGDPETGTTGEPLDCAPDLQVLRGSYSIENSLDVEALAAYKEITGDLTIHAPGLASLAGLQCLQRVGGDLEIRETGLSSLDGLDSLAEVGGQLVIEDNAELADLHALGSLASIGATPQEFGYFKLKGNLSLKDLSGLGALSFVGHSVHIASNGIETLAGLGAASIGGELRFEYNFNLVDVLDVAEFLPKSTVYFMHNKKLWCGNAEMAFALMQANGFMSSMFLHDNLNGCGDL